METSRLTDDPLWYKDAVIYELHIRAFLDSDDDGVGDILGLVRKLDYLQDLGITAIWLLPFYPSPLRDDGYDIADYTTILPVYGEMSSFRTLVREAHRRGIRIITELVINHTSDQHPWFQRARQSPRGSRWRNFYVWSDQPDKYRDARIIFRDTERSNWTWDPVAQAYYWHRFYSHQPDLNYDNAEVRREIFRVVDFWLNQGVDGLRVDAVPYLYEREGTSCENLPETHNFVRELRKHVDTRFKNRMLLAEANQWPEDVVAYFGKGDEFHMAFHFPLMPRMFMAIQMEDRFPIVDILRQTPPIPETCQWATFLRNHDELTLEMVTDEDRDYMYRMYARDPAARLNLGIRRRLAPLLKNDRKKIELMNILLFSSRGTPVIYYGDEIGMGDNIYLGDRNGVRTPMQWSPDLNAGFSKTNPQKLYLPVIIDPEYHYETVNVETQERNPESLLWWMKRLIGLNRRHRAFGRGDMDFIQTPNRKIIAFVRRHEKDTVLVVANLSHAAQFTNLDLGKYAGCLPVEIFGQEQFASIGENPYPLTLGPYGYYWFELQPPLVEAVQAAIAAGGGLPELDTGFDELFDEENWNVLGNVLGEYVRNRRWFRSKAYRVHSSEIQDVVPLRLPRSRAYLVLVRLEYDAGEPETYALMLTAEPAEPVKPLLAEYPHAFIAYLREDNQPFLLYDALFHKTFCEDLLDVFPRRRKFNGSHSEVVPAPTDIFKSLRGTDSLVPAIARVEQTNTSLTYGSRLIMKFFRRLEEGPNPDAEISLFLSEVAHFSPSPRVAGTLEYKRRRAKPATLALLQELVANEGDAWQFSLDALRRYFESVISHPTVKMPPVPPKPVTSLLVEVPELARETIGTYIEAASLLGQRTAELHTALASGTTPDFAPEPFTLEYQASLYQSLRSDTVQVFQLLRQSLPRLPQDARANAEAVLAREDEVIKWYRRLRSPKLDAMRIRAHGDYHLGQVLFTGKDFVIIDFEGEPARPLSQRRWKHSPLRDVAGMIRSFDYATQTALERYKPAVRAAEDLAVLEQWALFWYTWVSVSFLTSYLKIMAPTGLLPRDPAQMRNILDAKILDKAVYEIGYELNNRPEWVKVPINGMLRLLNAPEE